MTDKSGETGQLGLDLATVLQEELRQLVEGSAADLSAAATRIATNAVQAAALGRTDLLDECRDTARLVLEQNRLRAVDGSWDAAKAVIGGVLRTLALALAQAGGTA